MSINYLSDYTGATIAVQIPIDDWIKIKTKYPDIENVNSEVPLWQQELVNKRLNALAENPERLLPVETLFEELDKK